jgi:hypothetical protein
MSDGMDSPVFLRKSSALVVMGMGIRSFNVRSPT